MRLHVVISRSLSGSIVTLYLGVDRAEALATYTNAKGEGEVIEMYSYLEVSRRKVNPAKKPK